MESGGPLALITGRRLFGVGPRKEPHESSSHPAFVDNLRVTWETQHQLQRGSTRAAADCGNVDMQEEREVEGMGGGWCGGVSYKVHVGVQEKRTAGSSGQQHSGGGKHGASNLARNQSVTVTMVMPKGELKKTPTTCRLIGRFSVPFEGGHSDFFSALVVPVCKR